MDRIDLIRHFYDVETGRRVMENTFGKVAHDPAAVVQLRQDMEKMSTVADPELLKLALYVAGGEDVFEVYENLGGTFKKEALGAPMFGSPPPLPTAPGMSAPKIPQAPKPMGPSSINSAPQVPKQQQPQLPGQSQGNDSGKVKVQLESPSPGVQGTSVSVG